MDYGQNIFAGAVHFCTGPTCRTLSVESYQHSDVSYGTIKGLRRLTVLEAAVYYFRQRLLYYIAPSVASSSNHDCKLD